MEVVACLDPSEHHDKLLALYETSDWLSRCAADEQSSSSLHRPCVPPSSNASTSTPPCSAQHYQPSAFAAGEAAEEEADDSLFSLSSMHNMKTLLASAIIADDESGSANNPNTDAVVVRQARQQHDHDNHNGEDPDDAPTGWQLDCGGTTSLVHLAEEQYEELNMMAARIMETRMSQQSTLVAQFQGALEARDAELARLEAAFAQSNEQRTTAEGKLKVEMDLAASVRKRCRAAEEMHLHAQQALEACRAELTASLDKCTLLKKEADVAHDRARSAEDRAQALTSQLKEADAQEALLNIKVEQVTTQLAKLQRTLKEQCATTTEVLQQQDMLQVRFAAEAAKAERSASQAIIAQESLHHLQLEVTEAQQTEMFMRRHASECEKELAEEQKRGEEGLRAHACTSSELEGMATRLTQELEASSASRRQLNAAQEETRELRARLESTEARVCESQQLAMESAAAIATLKEEGAAAQACVAACKGDLTEKEHQLRQFQGAIHDALVRAEVAEAAVKEVQSSSRERQAQTEAACAEHLKALEAAEVALAQLQGEDAALRACDLAQLCALAKVQANHKPHSQNILRV
jgi:chromosome segregation ATPase